MSHRLVASLLALALSSVGVPLACAPSPGAVGPPASEPSVPSASVSGAASDSAAAAPIATASEAPAPAPTPTADVAPPCVDGEVVMGTCICAKGKGADATGHCVYMPCPSSAAGGTAFRDPATGQCMECRPGAKPTPDGKCVR